jgi:hypothetical protein
MASAIACLGEIVSTQLNFKTRDNELLQKLMDTARILCDIQYSDSSTRVHFILSSLKKDMKEHLTSTKIDSLLFGENLADTIKCAKAVNKSGIELKADLISKNQAKRAATGPAGSKPLNRKAPAPARRQPAAPARSRAPAAPRAPPPLPPPHAHSSRTSWQTQFAPPPPPPPTTARRRY